MSGFLKVLTMAENEALFGILNEGARNAGRLCWFVLPDTDLFESAHGVHSDITELCDELNRLLPGVGTPAVPRRETDAGARETPDAMSGALLPQPARDHARDMSALVTGWLTAPVSHPSPLDRCPSEVTEALRELRDIAMLFAGPEMPGG